MWKLGHAVQTELLPVVTRTASGTTAVFDIKDYTGDLLLTLYSSAASAADSLTCIAQTADNIGFTVGATTAHLFTDVTDAGTANEVAVIKADEVGRYLRVQYVVSGATPSITFGISMLGTKTSR